MGHVHHSKPPGNERRGHVKLAPGVQLSRDSDPPVLLVPAVGKVHLNHHALAILELCDGSRSRDRAVVDALLRTDCGMRAADVAEFLDAAQARGWIVEST